MGAMGDLILIALVVLVGYLVSLRLHPWRNCRPCKGTGRHRGALYKYSQRSCTACGGNGRRGRLGVRVIHSGARVWGETRPERTVEERGRNLGR
jgi:hypothetical protein